MKPHRLARVSEVIRDSGLLSPDKVDQVRTRAGVGAFSDALVEEGFASSLGVARSRWSIETPRIL